MDEELEPLDITGLEDLVTQEQMDELLPKLNALDDLNIDPALPSYFRQNEMIRPTTNELPDFTTLSNTAQDLQNNYMQSAYFYQQPPHTYLSPDAEMANSLLSTTPASYNDAAMAQYYAANFSYLFPMDIYDRNNKVGKKTNRRRATGIATIDPKTGKKIITAATCMDCYKAKKKCLYTLGFDSCTRCQKRGQTCVKRVDRRCQKVWSESGRIMPPLSVKNKSNKINTKNKNKIKTPSETSNSTTTTSKFDFLDSRQPSIFNMDDIPQIKQEEFYPKITAPDSLPTILTDTSPKINTEKEKKKKKVKNQQQQQQPFFNTNSIDYNAFQLTPQQAPQISPEEYQQFFEYQNTINYQDLYNQMSPKEQKIHMDAAISAAQTLATSNPFNQYLQQTQNELFQAQQQQQGMEFPFSLPPTPTSINPNNGFFTTQTELELQTSLSTLDEKTFNDISNFKFED